MKHSAVKAMLANQRNWKIEEIEIIGYYSIREAHYFNVEYRGDETKLISMTVEVKVFDFKETSYGQ